MPEDTYMIPKWFTRFVGFVAAAAIPWAAWMSMEVKTLGLRLDMITEVKTKLESHLNDPSIHHQGIAALREEISLLRFRVNQLEKEE
jgi:hypothetical protein